MADELGSIGRLSVSVNVDTSGFARGMAEVSAQMRAASAGMSSSMGKVESDVRSSTSRIGSDVDSVGRSTTKAASDVDRDTKKVSRSLGDVGVAASGLSRLMSSVFSGIGSGFSALGSAANRAGSVLVTGLGNALRGLGTVLPLVGDSIKGLGENLIKMQSSAGDAGEAAAGATADIAGMGPVGIAVAVAVIGLGVSLGVLAGALAAVGIAFVATAALFAGVIGGFAALGVGAVLLGIKMGGAGNTASTAWTKLTGDFKTMGDVLGKLVVGPATDILNWADSMIPKVQTLGAGIAKWFGQALPQVLAPTPASPATAPEKGGQYMSGGTAQAAQPAFATTALDDLTKALQKLGGLFQQAFGYVIAHKAEFEQFFNQTLNGAVQVIKGLMQNLEKLSGWWFANWPRMAPTVEAVFSAMGYVIQAFIGLCEFLALVVQTVGSSIIFTIHDVGDIFSWLGSTASTVFNDIITTVQNAASAIGSAIGSMFSGAGTIAQQQLNAVIGVINAFISAVDNSPLGALGVNIGTISPIGVTGVGPGPKASTSTVAGFFAQGGIVPGAGGGDTFPAMLTPGEVVLNRGAVAGLGGAGAADQLNHGLGGMAAAVGAIGGQCVVFLENLLGIHWPVAYASQMASDVNSQVASVGEVVVSTIPPYGHVALVDGPNSVIDSNWVAPLTIGIHALSDIPDIAGYINLGKGLPAGVPMGQGAQTVKTNINSILAGIVSGLSLPSLTGFFGSLPKNLLEQVAEDVGNFAANKIGSVGSWVGNDLAAIGFDSGHNILPPGLSVAWNGTGKPEALSTQGKGGRGDVNVTVTAPVNNPGEFSRQLRRELGWAMRVAG